MGRIVKLTALGAIVLFFLQALFGIFLGAHRLTSSTPVMNWPTTTRENSESVSYVPASTEEYLFQHVETLGFANIKNPSGCTLWNDANSSSIHEDLHAYLRYLEEYNRRIHDFKMDVTDWRLSFRDSNEQERLCQQLDSLLPPATASSFLSHISTTGYIEPLLPPLRHPAFCWEKRPRLLDLSYLVHDFGALCRRLLPHSRLVLVDMGASLQFHASQTSPAVYLTELYHQFGFPFDHIYAYEITPTPPAQVFKRVPFRLLPAYHWINVGVNATPGSPLNPFSMLLEHYNTNDIIIVKLDIDTSWLEVPLAHQLLHDDRLADLVDHFYFEHHVHLQELSGYWTKSMKGTVNESLELFQALRRKGVAAHYWV